MSYPPENIMPPTNPLKVNTPSDARDVIRAMGKVYPEFFPAGVLVFGNDNLSVDGIWVGGKATLHPLGGGDTVLVEIHITPEVVLYALELDQPLASLLGATPTQQYKMDTADLPERVMSEIHSGQQWAPAARWVVQEIHKTLEPMLKAAFEHLDLAQNKIDSDLLAKLASHFYQRIRHEHEHGVLPPHSWSMADSSWGGQRPPVNGELVYVFTEHSVELGKMVMSSNGINRFSFKVRPWGGEPRFFQTSLMIPAESDLPNTFGRDLSGQVRPRSPDTDFVVRHLVNALQILRRERADKKVLTDAFQSILQPIVDKAVGSQKHGIPS